MRNKIIEKPPTLQSELQLLASHYPTVKDLRVSICNGSIDLTTFSCPLFIIWKLLLLYESYDLTTWKLGIEKENQRYLELRQENRINMASLRNLYKGLGNLNQDDPFITDHGISTTDDPLLDNNASENLQELMQLIVQDVHRTYAEQPRLEDLTALIHEVLFIYSAQHSDVGYRQGMNELAAPTIYLSQQFNYADNPHIEAQAYAVFEAIMERTKPFYLPGNGPLDTPMIVTKARNIQQNILKVADPALHELLVASEVEPQLWAMKWLRLLFGREVGLKNLYQLWTLIFAADPSLEIADYICVVLILRVENRLVNTDTTGILRLLLNYPWDEHESLVDLVSYAVLLRDELSPLTGLKIKLAYNPAMQYTEGFENFVKKLDLGTNIDSVKSFANKFTQKLYHPSSTNGSTNGDNNRGAAPPAITLMADRDLRISELVDDSLKVFEKVHFNDQDIGIKRALQNLRLVYSYLQDPEKQVQTIPDPLTPGVKKVNQSEAESEVERASHFDTGFIKLTPARASLAQSDFSWMLSSPDSGKPSGFKPKKDKRSLTDAMDLFELS